MGSSRWLAFNSWGQTTTSWSFNEESEWIIYLTGQELQELKATLEATLDPRWELDSTRVLWESFHEFIENQKAEWLSSSDLFEWMEGLPEWLAGLWDTLDEMSHETLFGPDGVMKDLELSATAQDNISVSLTMSSMRELQNIEGITLENFEEKSKELSETLNIISEVAGQTETTEQWNTPYKSILDTSQSWEGNYIFMDAVEWIKFFDWLFSWEIQESNLEAYIEDRNLPEWSTTEITHRMTVLQDVWRDELLTLMAQLQGWDIDWWVETTTTGWTIADTIDEIDTLEPEQRESAIDRLKNGNMFERMLAAILEAFESIGLFNENSENNWDTDDGETDNEDTTEAEEVALTPEQQKNNRLIELINNLEMPWDSLLVEELTWDPDLARRIVLAFEWVSPEETFEETFQNLITENNKWESIWNMFREYWFQDSIPEWTSYGNIALKYIEEYSRYRNSDGVRWVDSWRTTWESWATQRQAENWRVWGR